MTFRSVGEAQICVYPALLPNGRDLIETTVFFSCERCNKGLCVTASSQLNGLHGLREDLRDNPLITITETYPAIREIEAPEYTNKKVAALYAQALRALRAAKANPESGFELTAIGFRSALEEACKLIHPEGTGTLYQRIEKLAEEQRITPDMKDWAHTIRDIGNDGAHGDPVTLEDAEDTQAFTELFLMVE